MAEFTGERVIPGEVDPDLWNEHMARYAFARRLAGGRRVLDAGCGAGYGAAELAEEAGEVLAIDIAAEAIDYAREHYQATNLRFERASCFSIPAPAASFELVVAFEIIEHLHDWRAFLGEVKRVLSAGGQFVVSTPNKLYYSEARAGLGPNPFHVHEFDYDEFRHELEAVFPKVALYLENHTDAMVFVPTEARGAAESRLAEGTRAAQEAHFYLAVCSHTGETAIPPFVYVPRTANMLREREAHIEVLEEQLRERMARVAELQQELAIEQAKARKRVAELEAEVREAVAAATRLAGELDAKVAELAQCVEHLHAAEHTVEERTRWAATLDGQLQALWSTRWVRFGAKLHLLPRPESGT